MSTAADSPHLPLPRLVFLDWVRILAFGLLVFYHVGMYYVGWDWHIKSPAAGPALEPWMRLSSPWRMDLLFLVSGTATACMLAAPGAATGTWLRARMRRLLLPLLFGMLVVVPPQSWIEVVHKLGYAGSYADFLQIYLVGYGGFCFAPGQCLVLPTWNHLWFLPYLMLYTVLLWALLRLRPDGLDDLAACLPKVLAGARLLWLPVLLLALDRVLLRGHFPVTHALVDDWFAHSQYLVVFLLGAVLARSPAMWTRMVQQRWVALSLALGAWVLWASGVPSIAGGAASAWTGPVANSVQQWCAIVAVLGFARNHLNRDNALRRYLTDAVFPLYILHQTVIVVLAHALGPWQLPVAGEGAVLVLATFGLCLAAYEGVRRLRWLHPLFGLRARAFGRQAGGDRFRVPLAPPAPR